MHHAGGKIWFRHFRIFSLHSYYLNCIPTYSVSADLIKPSLFNRTWSNSFVSRSSAYIHCSYVSGVHVFTSSGRCFWGSVGGDYVVN